MRAVGAGVWARIGGLQELSIYTAVSGGSRGRAGAERGAVRAVGVVWAEGVWARIGVEAVGVVQGGGVRGGGGGLGTHWRPTFYLQQ